MDRKRFGNLPAWAYPVQSGNMLSGAARSATTPIDVMGMLSTLPEGVNGTMQGYDPSLRERIGWGAGNLFGSIGADKHLQRYAADKIGGVVDLVPGVGDVVGVDDAYQDYKSGNLGMAAAGLGLAAVGAIPGVGDAAAKAGKKGIRAFHGSPHDFDRFSLDKIGTGEGAQAYGHGLYFAESEGVAKSYRDDLSQMNFGSAKRALDNAGNDVDVAIREAREKIARLSELPPSARRTAQIGINEQKIANLTRFKETGDMGLGRMYEVNINADPEDFLDWDKPFNSADDLERFAAKFDAIDPVLRKRIEDYGYMRQQMGQPMPDGNDIIREIMGGIGSTDAARATDTMREAGIPGIKYLDAGSRAAGDGSRNYVVFDDKLIDIVKKYGIAAALSAGLISQQMAEQMQAQGLGEL